MITVDINLADQVIISLGKRGENEVRQIVFDISEWYETFGTGGKVVLLAEPDDSDQPYTADISVDEEAGQVTWVITNSDTSLEGFGRCEPQYYCDDIIKKSWTWRTRVDCALGESGEPPPEFSVWIDEVLAASAAATAAAEAVAGSTAEAQEAAEQSRQAEANTQQLLAEVQSAVAELEGDDSLLPLSEDEAAQIVRDVWDELQ